jgi:hypothetical protein
VVTPPLAATKSARRCWQRAQQNARMYAAAECQNEQARSQRGPASAEPAGTSNWRRSTSARNSSWDIGLQSGGEWQEDGEGQEDSIADWHGFDGKECIPRGWDPHSINFWPTSITVYSHDRHSECCWHMREEMDQKSCIRLDCRPLYDPNARTKHDGRHPDVQAGLLRHKKNAPECFLDMCKAVRVHLRKHAGRHCSIAFWCNRGKHRSVGCAELFNAILCTQKWASAAINKGCELYLEHLSLDYHKHACAQKGCEDCCDKNPYDNPHIQAAQKMWELSA